MKVFLLSYYILALIVVIIPYPWWYYSVGGIFQIYDSPFQLNVYLLGENLILSQIVNILLNAFRIYVTLNLVYGLILTIKGKAYKYSTMFWLPLLYLIDPIIIYFVINYLVSANTGISYNYPLIFVGSEIATINYEGANIQMIITSEPLILFWLSLLPVILYVISWIKEK